MAYVLTTPLRDTLIARFSAAMSALNARRARRKIFTRTRNELSALSDTNLADLGLTRAEITRVAMQSAAAAAL